MTRRCRAVITVATGRHGTRQFPVQRVESYTTDQSIDNDADSFSIDVGDGDLDLNLVMDRDNEVRVSLYIDDPKLRLVPIFNGIVDVPQWDETKVISMEGRDTPSSLAVDSDAMPGRWKHVSPAKFIEQRAKALGIVYTSLPKLSSINSLYTDGSEKEWAFWYRIARMRDCYMWSDEVGRLIVAKLGYALTPTYRFGVPTRGSKGTWIACERLSQSSNKQARRRRVLVYGEDAKKGKATVAQGVDTSIAAWRKKPLVIMTDTKAKNQAELKKTADEEVFESIVGTQELILVVHDEGTIIRQNRMALVNLPSHGINNEPWFVVGVQRQGGHDGMVQIVRLREKGFALSKRVPDAPALKNATDAAANKPVSSIGAALSQMPGIKWADSFVRATQEFGVANGWDFAVFLGVLLSICAQETGFQNEREGGRGLEWQPYDQWVNSGERLTSTRSAAQLERDYQGLFANAAHNTINPYRPREAGVGPMQLTYLPFKQWADAYGWNGVAKEGEYDGGRWNPDSNIRAAARALIGFLKQQPAADPTNPDTIWIGVARYNGSAAYADAVRAKYKSTYQAEASGAVAAVKSLPPGSTDISVQIPGHGTLSVPDNTPDEVRKAINWALRMLGDPYVYGGYGPHYDCSSLVTKALSTGGAYLRNLLDEPNQETAHHGDSTYSLFKTGRFSSVSQDQLLPGDLVFFRGNPPEHVGMYLDDGLFIHDPHTGDVVKVSSLHEDYYRQNYSGARRVAVWPVRGPR